MIYEAKTLKNTGETSGLEDFDLFIIMGCAGAIGLIVFLVAVIIPKYREKAIIKLKEAYHKFRYNGLIRSFQITYIKQCVTFGKIVKELI